MITPDLIRAIVPTHPAPILAATKAQTALDRWGIRTPRQVAMFLAQGSHESGLQPVEEDLNYRAERICQVWPARFPTLASAQPYAFNARALANKVYAGRGGNDFLGMGWDYHGRGIVQLTFHDNYALHGRRTGFDLLRQPELLLQYGVGFLAYGSFWDYYALNAAAERGDVRAVTLAINGGLLGLEDRERLYQRALNLARRPQGLLSAAPPRPDADAAADLDARNAVYVRVLGLIAS